MLRRLLNIASIVCLALCMALMGMWVRSYQTQIGLLLSGRHFDFGSIQGRMVFAPNASGPQEWRLATLNPTSYDYDPPYMDLHRGISNPFGFLLYFSGVGTVVIVPYWFLVLASGSLAMAFQLRWPWRFNLRSMFIATTFLAVVLGMIAWLDRAWIGK
jgi:hypothetical protein